MAVTDHQCRIRGSDRYFLGTHRQGYRPTQEPVRAWRAEPATGTVCKTQHRHRRMVCVPLGPPVQPARPRDFNGDQVRPDQVEERRCSVSYEVFVPRATDLAINTHNGGISVADVAGRIQFAAHNGGVSLNRLSGSVKGETVNGGLSISLAGERWEGEGFDVRTTNGGVESKGPAELFGAAPVEHRPRPRECQSASSHRGESGERV